MKYQIIASGTFDLFHDGHKSFLKKSLEIGDEVIICITSNLYVKSFKDGKDIEDFEIRRQAVFEFLQSIGAKEKTQIISIDDVYGPLLMIEYNPQAIAVTPENEKIAVKINTERAKKSLSELEIKVIEMNLAQDGGAISSSRIRNGEIDREGKSYINPKWRGKVLILPESLRAELQKPFGKVLSSFPLSLTPEKTITIGDVTTQIFNKNKTQQLLSIIDFAVQRKKKFDQLSDLEFESRIKTIIVKNPAGSITTDLFDATRKAFENPERKVILVEGEEDLAVLPAILVSPLGFTIYYGQPDKGLVEIKITEGIKEKAFDLASKLELS